MKARTLALGFITSCALVLPAAVLAQEHHPQHAWDYGDDALGPSHWGSLKPEFAACKDGHRQSPIDINKPRTADLAAIQFDYKPSALHILDNGHTIMINYEPGSYVTLDGKKYALKQFHFHRPSEEKINGKAYGMVAHLVHQDPSGKLAVVAVLLEPGSDNSLVHELWTHLPKEAEKEEVVENVRIDLNKLLPADRGYYTFTGSLTTPPCSEDVTWFVLKRPVTISAAEIKQFATRYPDNARPTQPLYDRVVQQTK